MLNAIQDLLIQVCIKVYYLYITYCMLKQVLAVMSYKSQILMTLGKHITQNYLKFLLRNFCYCTQDGIFMLMLFLCMHFL